MDQLYMVAITAAILSFNGCGDTNSTVETPNTFTTNLGQPQNSFGYYGDDVYFAGRKIVGTWVIYHTPNDEAKSILYSDGTTESRVNLYGVDEEGDNLNLLRP